MDECNNKLCVRILNQSAQIVKAVVRVVNGINVEELSCQIIIAGKSEYIYFPPNIGFQNAMIDLYTCNTVSAQWVTFTTIPVDTLDVDLIWVTEVNGQAKLTPFGCSNTNDISGQLYYIQLHHNEFGLMRIYVSYYVDGKAYSKKMSAVAKGKSKKVWVPIEATSLTIKVQDWQLRWYDVKTFHIAAITDNCCYEAYLETYGLTARQVECIE